MGRSDNQSRPWLSKQENMRNACMTDRLSQSYLGGIYQEIDIYVATKAKTSSIRERSVPAAVLRSSLPEQHTGGTAKVWARGLQYLKVTRPSRRSRLHSL
jgi:hypothetical protein